MFLTSTNALIFIIITNLSHNMLAIITPSQFSWAGIYLPINSKKQCLDLVQRLQPLLPSKRSANPDAARLYKDRTVLTKLCHQQHFGQAALHYHALKKALKSYQNP